MVPAPELRSSHDHYAAVAANGNMARRSENSNVVQMAAWGTRLSLELYDFSAAVPSATIDVTRLAKEVNLISLVLRQAGSNLKRDADIASVDGAQSVKEILQQFQQVFHEVESIVPLKRVQREQDESSLDGVAVSTTHDWAWNENSRLKASYLLGHLESLKLTLSVLLQCLYVAKITTWSHHQKTQHAIDAVSIERLQMQALIIEQQMSLIRVSRLYQELSLNKAAFLEGFPHQGSDIVQYDQREANPRALVPYQEMSLSQARPATTETEDLVRVKRIARQYVENLLHRWTRLEEMEQRVVEEGSPRQHGSGSDRGRWEQPSVESDSEDDDGYRRDGPPRLAVNSAGPVLMPVNEDINLDRGTPSPASSVPRSQGINIPRSPGVNVPPSLGINIPPSPGINLSPPQGINAPRSPGINAQRGSAPVNAPTPRRHSTANHSPSQNNPYFPQTPSPSMPHRNRYSPAPSPLSSPRTSFSGEAPPTPRDSSGSLRGEPVQPPTPPGPAIPWRLKLNQATWDFHGPSIADSNTAASYVGALSDRNTVTELMAEYVSRRALDQREYQYQAVQKDMGDGRRTRFVKCFLVRHALVWNDVLDLVRLTEALRNRRDRDWDGRRARRGQGPLYVQTQPVPPPLDRTMSAPSGTPMSAGPRHGWKSGGEGSDESADEGRRSSRRRGSVRRNSSKGSSIAGVGKKMVAAGGVAAILSEIAGGLSSAF